MSEKPKKPKRADMPLRRFPERRTYGRRKAVALTDRQIRALRTLREAMLSGRVPTYRELARLLDVKSTQGVNCHIAVLRRKGYLLPASDPPCARDFRLAGLVLRVEYEDSEAGRRLRAAVESGVPS